MQQELTRLRDLHDRGVLTDEEFERARLALNEGRGTDRDDREVGSPGESDPSGTAFTRSGSSFVGSRTSQSRWGRLVAVALGGVALLAAGAVGAVVLLGGSGETSETQAISDIREPANEESVDEPSSAETGGDDEPVSEQQAAAAEDEPETAEPDVAAADPNEPASYYTLDGTRPALSPDCYGVMGFCLNSPVEAVTDALGREVERYEGAEQGSMVRRWDVGPSSWLTVEADGIGSISQIAASMYPAPDDLRVALPESELTFGEATFSDVITAYGEPANVSAEFVEGSLFFDFEYITGPEGTVIMRFALVLDQWEAEEESAAYGDNAGDRDAIIAAISDRLVTSFSVGY